MISAIVLAAGESKRMKHLGAKQMLYFEDKTILDTVILKLSKIIETVIVVLGFKGEEIKNSLSKKTLELKNIQFAFNKNYKNEMLSSIKVGLSSLDLKIKGFLIYLGDQPFINEETIESIISYFNLNENKIIVPVFENGKGHPVLIPTVFKDEILNLTEDKTLKDFMDAHKKETLYLEVKDNAILKDLDYPEDYINLIEKK